jgi:hypothetical protein
VIVERHDLCVAALARPEHVDPQADAHQLAVAERMAEAKNADAAHSHAVMSSEPRTRMPNSRTTPAAASPRRSARQIAAAAPLQQ